MRFRGLIGWLVLATVAAVASTTVAVSGSRVEATTAPVHSDALACRPLATAEAWSARFRDLAGRWATADQATSLALPDGRVLWLFGDTVQGRLVRTESGLAVRDWRMPHNSMALTWGTTCDPIRIHTGPRGTSLLPDARGDAHWPMSATMDGGRLYVFASRVRLTGDDFFGVGTRLARVRLPEGTGRPRFLAWRRTPSTGVDELSGVQWGAAAVKRGRHTYVYGTRRSSADLVFGRALYVARVKRGRLPRRQAWRYWDGGGWVKAQRRATPVKPAVGGVSATLSVHHVRGRWVAVTKADDFLGDRVVMLTARKPYGPWHEVTLRTTHTATDLARGDVTYAAMAHPEAALASGGLLVTLSRNNLDSAKTLADVARGRPLFFETPWPDVP